MGSHKFEGFTPISSDHIDGARYNAMDRIMHIRFQNGYVYAVHAVSPAVYQDFMSAPSQGSYYHQQIKGSFHVERIK